MAHEVRRKWLDAGFPEQLLLNVEDLTRLVDIAYQASLLQEEHVPVRCRLAFGAPSDFQPIADSRPDQLVVYRFAETSELTAHDIRKLAAAAGYYRALLGVELGPDNELRIWGMVGTGTRWVNRVDGGRFLGIALPPNLVIQIVGPGHLVAASGHDRILETSGGQLLSDGFDPFHSQWLPARFSSMRESLLEELARTVSSHSFQRICDAFIKNAAQSVVRRALSLIRSRHHGGMMIYLPEGVADSPLLHDWVRFRVRFQHDASSRRFRHLMQLLLKRLIVIAETQGLAVVTWEDYQRLHDAELAGLDEAFSEFAHLLADLMSVDGALVLDRGFRLIGFGGEIMGESYVTRIHRALDLEATRTLVESANSSGTRHRAAYRLISGIPEAVAVVVSQDGAVRFVADHHGQLTYWPYLP